MAPQTTSFMAVRALAGRGARPGALLLCSLPRISRPHLAPGTTLDISCTVSQCQRNSSLHVGTGLQLTQDTLCAPHKTVTTPVQSLCRAPSIKMQSKAEDGDARPSACLCLLTCGSLSTPMLRWLGLFRRRIPVVACSGAGGAANRLKGSSAAVLLLAELLLLA